MLLHRTRDSIRFSDILDAMISDIPNRVVDLPPVECKHHTCTYKVSCGTGSYCGNHLSHQSINEMLRELIENKPPTGHNSSCPLANRRISIRKNLYYRYRVHMSQGQRNDFDTMITSFRLCGPMGGPVFSTPDPGQPPYWSPERPDPILIKGSFTNELHQTKNELLDAMYAYLVDNSTPVNTESIDNLFFDINDWYPGDDFIPLDVSQWIRMQQCMSDYMLAYANFVDDDITALDEGELPIPIGGERGTFEWHDPMPNIYGASLLLIEGYFMKVISIRVKVHRLELHAVGECPVCCEETTLGKLPKCTHCMCQGCWYKWTTVTIGNNTCPLCRAKQF